MKRHRHNCIGKLVAKLFSIYLSIYKICDVYLFSNFIGKLVTVLDQLRTNFLIDAKNTFPS